MAACGGRGWGTRGVPARGASPLRRGNETVTLQPNFGIRRPTVVGFARRVAAATTLVAALFAPLAADAQRPTRVYRLVYLGVTPITPATQPNWDALVEGLRERGYVVGQNLVLESRWSHGSDEKLAALAKEIVDLKFDIILTAGASVRPAKQATSTIPIVMVQTGDPVGTGIVASLTRPGGNITGSTNLSEGLAAKRLQLLKEVVPAASRVAVIFDPKPPFTRRVLPELETAARAMGIRIEPVPVSTPDDLTSALTALSRDLPSALLEIESQVGLIHRRQIIDFAMKHRLPAIYPFRWSVADGGLMAYEASLTALYRRAGYFVDRILKGTPPGDLPVEQPTKFDLILNARTAKAIGLSFPPSVVLRADAVIE